jgi:hypothetical protein
MTTQQIADRLVALCRNGQMLEAEQEFINNQPIQKITQNLIAGKFVIGVVFVAEHVAEGTFCYFEID